MIGIETRRAKRRRVLLEDAFVVMQRYGGRRAGQCPEMPIENASIPADGFIQLPFQAAAGGQIFQRFERVEGGELSDLLIGQSRHVRRDAGRPVAARVRSSILLMVRHLTCIFFSRPTELLKSSTMICICAPSFPGHFSQ